MARVLAVDDQPHVTRVVARSLSRLGHEVVRAANGRAALELLRAESFDLLITDVDMPEMDGLSLVRHPDTLKRVRAAIVITGRTDYEALGTTDGASNVHFLPKPFSPSRLAELVKKILEAPEISPVEQSPARTAGPV